MNTATKQTYRVTIKADSGETGTYTVTAIREGLAKTSAMMHFLNEHKGIASGFFADYEVAPIDGPNYCTCKYCVADKAR